MTDIRRFTGERVREIQVDDGFNEPTSPASDFEAPKKPSHGGYPTVSATAAVDVVRALQFYAAGGEDRGETARAALLGMSSVIAANEGVAP